MIRKAKIEDIDGILNLLGQVLYVHYQIRPDLFKEKGSKYSKEQLADIINNEKTPIFVYEEDNKIIGHCFCIINEIKNSTNINDYKNLFIDDLCIDENYRNKGIGKEMYNYVKEYAKENGIYNITLHVWEGNESAFNFYKNLGMNFQQYTLEEIIDEKKSF